jgi:hypothetical protein
MRVLALIVLVTLLFADRGTGAAQQPAEVTLSIEHATAASNGGPTLFGGSSLTGRLLTAIGAAALGAGTGYFASQIVRGDWDDTGGVHRPTWAAVGGSIGFALGFSFPLPGRARPAEATPRLERNRLTISSAELDDILVQTAFEAVNLLRPEWLNDRGRHIIGESADESVIVYQDGTRLGGLSWLHQIQADHVRSMRYIDAGEATGRFGAGNSHPVILVTTGLRK